MPWMRKIADFEYDKVRDTVRQILDAADNTLPSPAANAVHSFVGHGPGSRGNDMPLGLANFYDLEDAYSEQPSEKGIIIRQQLEAAWLPVAEQLRAVIGDPVPLFRHQRGQAGETWGERNVLSWTLNLQFAEHLLGPDRTLMFDVVDKDGWYLMTGVSQERAQEIADACNMAGGITPELQRKYNIDDNTLEPPYSIRNAGEENFPERGEVMNDHVPLDRVVWATDRANQMEFIVQTR